MSKVIAVANQKGGVAKTDYIEHRCGTGQKRKEGSAD